MVQLLHHGETEGKSLNFGRFSNSLENEHSSIFDPSGMDRTRGGQRSSSREKLQEGPVLLETRGSPGKGQGEERNRPNRQPGVSIFPISSSKPNG